MIPLNKNPGFTPTGVGKVLRRITGKVVMILCKKEGAKAAGSFPLSAGQDAGAEAAIHAMRDIFFDVDTDVVLLIDVDNAFNYINRKVILQSLKLII